MYKAAMKYNVQPEKARLVPAQDNFFGSALPCLASRSMESSA